MSTVSGETTKTPPKQARAMRSEGNWIVRAYSLQNFRSLDNGLIIRNSESKSEYGTRVVKAESSNSKRFARKMAGWRNKPYEKKSFAQRVCEK